MIPVAEIADEHGLTPEYTTQLMREFDIPVERIRSSKTNRMINAVTEDGAKAFDQARADQGYYKLGVSA